MITRRSFLSALAALPFVGKLIPQQTNPLAGLNAAIDDWNAAPLYPTPGLQSFATFPSRIKNLNVVGDTLIVNTIDGVYEVDQSGEMRRLYPARLTFAEWDRMYQG